MAVNITTSYDGEVLEQLLVRATTGNELVTGGHIRVQPNVKKKFALPRLKVGKMLQKRIEQPKDTDSKGDFSIDEKYLEPKEFMAFTTFNPRVFETIWRPFQPTGDLVFRELPTEVQNQFLSEMAKVVNFELGYHYINGVHGAGTNELFDGILTQIKADSDVEDVSVASTPITEANILDTLETVRTFIPQVVKNNPNLKLFMSREDADIYDNVLTNKTYKGVDYTERNKERYKGISMAPLVDWPKDVIVAAVASPEIDSNFWAGVDYADDEDVIKIGLLDNAGEKYFFKMLMKADTNIVYGEDIVLYDGR